jgi:hypothetical protein
VSDRVRYIVERFPDLEYAITQYSSDNRFFRGLCEDYGEAVEALRHCEASDSPFTRACGWRPMPPGTPAGGPRSMASRMPTVWKTPGSD